MLIEVLIPKPDRARADSFAAHRWKEHHRYYRDLLRLVVLSSSGMADPQPVATVGPVNDGRGSLTVYDIPAQAHPRVVVAVEAWAEVYFKSDAEVRSEARGVGSLILGGLSAGLTASSAVGGAWGAIAGIAGPITGIIGRALSRDEGPTEDDAVALATEVGAAAVLLGETETAGDLLRDRMLSRMGVADRPR